MRTEPSRNIRRISRRGLLGGTVAVLATGGAGTAWALDRFVLEHPEVANASSRWSDSARATVDTAAPAGVAATGASVIWNKEVTGSGSTTVTSYVADLRLSAGTDLRSAFAQDTFGQNIVADTSAIARQNGASWAVNGDYYGFRDTGIVVRNGVAFRDRGARQGLVLGRDGTLALYDETATSASRLIADGAWHTLSFGPGIVADSAVVPGIEEVEIDTNVGNHSIQGNQPRTGLGMIETNHLLAIVVDGRSPGYSRGVTLPEFARMFVDRGAQVAYNLDGGGSSVMYADGAVVSNPLGAGRERGTSDILYVAG